MVFSKKKKKSVQKSKNPYKNLYLYGQIRTSRNTGPHYRAQTRWPDICNVVISLQQDSCSLELIKYKGAVPEQGAVYKTWFFNRPGAERVGSCKNQFSHQYLWLDLIVVNPPKCGKPESALVCRNAGIADILSPSVKHLETIHWVYWLLTLWSRCLYILSNVQIICLGFWTTRHLSKPSFYLSAWTIGLGVLSISLCSCLFM